MIHGGHSLCENVSHLFCCGHVADANLLVVMALMHHTSLEVQPHIPTHGAVDLAYSALINGFLLWVRIAYACRTIASLCNDSAYSALLINQYLCRNLFSCHFQNENLQLHARVLAHARGNEFCGTCALNCSGLQLRTSYDQAAI